MDTSDLKPCNVVMKGGITSGIVYPGLVCKLATRYRFESIGGTSAGAIAASLTAAAEYARQTGQGSPHPFDEIGKVPGWLGADSEAGGGSNLFHLFQPQPEMRELFNFAVSFLVSGPGRRIWCWAQVFWLEVLLGLLPGLVLIYLAAGSKGWRFWVAVVLGVLVAKVGSLVGVLVGVVRRIGRLPRHHYGLCLGFKKQPGSKAQTLVEWLNNKLNEISGKDPDHPLTFGDLRKAGVTLKMNTTCLTWGRPFTLPFESAEFFFSPQEFQSFFPKEVVQWMVDHQANVKFHEKTDLGDRVPLPAADDLPVIVAARMSLSFPVLFCTVPLYAIDWSRRRRSADEPLPEPRVPGDALGADEPRTPERVWFIDGGITSNFPLHLFDSPLPRCPTFAANLQDLRPDLKDPNDRVWMPSSNRGGIAKLWTRLSTQDGLGGAIGLLGATFDSARNWNDTLQTFIPGYRDRIVHVSLDNEEGGLRLNMKRTMVTALSRYGEEAGQKLIDHFIDGVDNGAPTPMTWDNHRWVRYRSSIASLEVFMADFAASLETYQELIRRDPEVAPRSYPLHDDQRDYANKLRESLLGLGQQMSQSAMQSGAPKPQPNLKMRPPF